ncbi:SRPBCC domain-containing protein [Chlorobium phaeobacteroides]|uniref:Activator of Hsp90 ATPase 1 family protein n=1 Tax=Chlorobium phaeobacteroides (strain DSM 266 / SMG 266 / 2430) TaxID=290317 RepID=A1BGG5_CHLPD|nr:SRPBCC domain-containing protein [Chlorobium phaeobacteroides]ABL65492.1 Activator of Hsp90 ATPase 1 family protein [Chlorobium phaeobacteroides DSM 266]
METVNEIRREIHIEASPEEVWAVVGDTEGYRTWNPFITAVQGNLRKGGSLSVTARFVRGVPALKFQAEVVRLEPERELSWRVSFAGGMLCALHSFTLCEQPPGGVLFIHCEQFTGIFGSLALHVVRRWFCGRYDGMNKALQACVIARKRTGS